MNTTPSLVEAAETARSCMRLQQAIERGRNDKSAGGWDEPCEAIDAALAAHQSREAALMECVEALRDLWASVTGGNKSCGHEHSCVCTGDRVRAALATLDQLGG